MGDELLEISDTGKAADRESVGLLVGRPAERRRMALLQLVLARMDHARSAAWLGGKRLKPTPAELAPIHAEINAAIGHERAEDEGAA